MNGRKPPEQRGFIAEWAVTIVLLLFGTTTLAQAFVIPTGSMEGNLLVGDHVIVDRVRYQDRERRAGEEVPFRSASNPAGPEPADTKTPSRLFAQQQAVERLLARLDTLPEDYRQALILAKIEGLTTAEMAERLGKSREAVALLVYRATKRFREVVKDSRA